MINNSSVKPLKKDEWAVVLDFLAHGHQSMQRSEPVAHVIGENFFSLLEIIVREGVVLKTGERVYIGEGKRDSIKYIRGRIDVKELTVAAKEELTSVIYDIIKKNSERFLDFFNKAGSITTRLHQIELLPGIGKRHLWAIIEARKTKPFESFKDLRDRVPLLPDPEKMIVKRIIEELDDKDKYRIFVPRIEKTQQKPRRIFGPPKTLRML